jgi:signal transduction histidine kinase
MKMKFSVYFALTIIVVLLFLAGAVSLLFALVDHYTSPLMLTALANIVAVVLLVFLITRGILGPLKQVQNIMKKVGEGNLDLKIVPPGVKEMQELGDTLNAMIARLRTSTEKVKEVDRMKTEFVSLAAHQLRTPLSAIKWSLQMLIEGDMGAITKKQKEFVSKTYESNERMITLINDLLNVTRIESGKSPYQPSLVQIEDVTARQVQLYIAEAERRGITLTCIRPEEKLPKVLADEEQIGIVIQNLIDNALHYSPQGGRVTVAATRDIKEVRVWVQDEGLGIPQEDQPKVFEKFFRASNVKKVHTEGSGLGLYITKHIVEIHGGKIWFTSIESKGTTFTFTLPIKF